MGARGRRDVLRMRRPPSLYHNLSLSMQTGGCVVVTVHADVNNAHESEESQEIMFARTLAHYAHYVMHVRTLPSGQSREVSGEVRRNGTSHRMHSCVCPTC